MAEMATVTPIRTTRVVVDEGTQQRMRELLERTRGIVFAPVRKVWGFFKGLFTRTLGSAPIRWVRATWTRGVGIVRSLADRLGRFGVAAAAVGTVTSHRGQAAIAAAGRFTVTSAAWVVDVAASAVEAGLKLIPGPTRWLAGKIGSARIRFGGKVSELLTWKGWKRAADTLDPDKPAIRWVNFIVRGELIRRLVGSFVGGWWRRWIVTGTLIGLFAPEEERREIMSLWREQREATRNRKRDAAVWTNPNGVPAEAGKPVVDAAALSDTHYRKIVELTLSFFAKDSAFPSESACAKALYNLVHPHFKELLRSQQAAKAGREYAGLMVHQFRTAEAPFDNLGEPSEWNPALELELRSQAEATVGIHNIPAPARV